ncbi:MAG: methyltransferase domain-containing protein [Spirochaetales bacterium]
MAQPPLERWLPRLLQVWRRGAAAPTEGLPQDGLTSAEADRVAVGVRELSKGLTGTRELAGAGYLGSEDLLGAYLLYYWPVSFAQTLSALRKGDIRRGSRALDLGSGPAPGAMALLEAGWTKVTAADRSAPALQKARELATLGGFELTTQVWQAEDAALPAGGPWDLILLGHFVNELAAGAPDRKERRAAFLERLASQLNPGGVVLLIEPASHGPNAEALALRDAVVARGWGVQGPCFYQKACPALVAGAACHDLLTWKVPHLVAQSARRAGIDKRELPFTWLALRPSGPPPADSSRYRVLSESMVNKAGRRRMLVCGEAGRFSLSAPGAYRSPLWLGLQRGDALTITEPEVRESGWGIGAATRLASLPGQGR